MTSKNNKRKTENKDYHTSKNLMDLKTARPKDLSCYLTTLTPRIIVFVRIGR